MLEQPAWTVPPAPFVGRESLVQDVVMALEHGVVCLHGQPGVGTTATAAAVGRRWMSGGLCAGVIGVRLAGERLINEVVLRLGVAVGAPLPGRVSSVLATLKQQHVMVILDDADLAADAVDALLALAPEIPWVLTSREPLQGRPFEVQPLSDEDMSQVLDEGEDPSHFFGLPGLTWLGGALDARDPWSGAEMVLPPVADLLAQLPMGLPITSKLGDIAPPIETHDGRAILPRCLREALGGTASCGLDALEAAVRDDSDQLQGVACDLVHKEVSIADAVLWRRAAENPDGDADLCALAAAAAARVLLRHFQAAEALSLCLEQLQRPDPLLPGVRALLYWVGGDALLAQGEEDEAEERYRAAAHDLRESRNIEVLSALLRACAHRWSVRGRERKARNWLGEARATLRDNPDAVARADALRIAADLAARSGELVGAGALYDEAHSILSRTVGADRERASVRVGQAALAMVRGQFVAAEEILADTARAAQEDPVVAGSVLYRRAELAVRRGRTREALSLLEQASARWRVAGSARGLCLALRLRGDVAAVAGDRVAASDDYRAAIELCVNSRDLLGLFRVLRHAVAVEREGIPGAHVQELERHLELVEVLLRVGR